ncbi:MarR family transcriptional regulator [Eggerthellaceae bacterium zg-887]|nr:MarR family transcriptional regulator [Xiamenia xianingshaonis]
MLMRSTSAMQDAQDRLLGEFTHVSNELDELYRVAAKRLGLSPSAYEILVVLRTMDGCTQKELCDECLLSKQTVNSAVHGMERAGLVRVESGGHRATQVWLTEEGRSLVAGRLDEMYEAERQAFRSLSVEERLAFVSLTKRFSEELKVRFAALKQRPGER